ncbi:MAG: hypothetical protein M1305_02365 [Candidatus Marsarchaeota archaeon]|nr:hypothetical protein [Candidatus Marsarchaeota archaeon]
MKVTIEFATRVGISMSEPVFTLDVSSPLLIDVLKEVVARRPQVSGLVFDACGRYSGFYDILLNGGTISTGAIDSTLIHERDRVTFLVQLQGGWNP